MAEYGENIYGNQEIIQRHAGDPKPTGVRRISGIGQESNEPYEEENVYINHDALKVPQAKPKAKPPNVKRGNYEVFNGQEEAKAATGKMAQASYDSSRESPPLYEEFDVDHPATNTGLDRTNWQQGIGTNTAPRGAEIRKQETVELQEVRSGIALSSTTPKYPESNEKGMIMKASRWPVFLGAVAIILALVALLVALLFGLNVIEVDAGCSCLKDDTGLQAQVDKLQKEIIDLRKELYLRRSDIATTSSIAPTAALRGPPSTPALTRHESSTSRLLEMSFEMSETLSVTKAISSMPNTSLPISFSITSSASSSPGL